MADLPARAPRVTVGMPVLNGGELFRRAIESILSQSFRDLEIIVSDNASTDGTDRRALEYAARDSRIVYHRQRETVPGLDNYRYLVQRAQGAYFFWAPHDDWWHSRFVEAGVAALDAHPQASAAMGTVRYFKPDGEEFLRYGPPYGLDASQAHFRARWYLEHKITDHLLYAIYRRSVLLTAPWHTSVLPEKAFIMHAVLSGPIVDGWEMEYFNQYVAKTEQEVADAHALPEYSFKYELPGYWAVVSEMWGGLSALHFARLLPVYLIRQNVIKRFVQIVLRRPRRKA